MKKFDQDDFFYHNIMSTNWIDNKAVILNPNGQKVKHEKKPYVLTKEKQIDNLINSDKPLEVKSVSRNFSIQLQQARNKAKLTQQQLAQKIGVKVDIIKAYENGSAKPDQKQINKIKKILTL